MANVCVGKTCIRFCSYAASGAGKVQHIRVCPISKPPLLADIWGCAEAVFRLS